MAKDPYRYFRIEARELLDGLGQGLLGLERGAIARAGVPPLLRLAHTLKGAARVVRQPAIAEAAHQVEDALVPWRDADTPAPPEALAAVLACLQRMEAQLAALPAGDAPASAPDAAPAQAAPGAVSPVVPAAARPEEPALSLRTDAGDIDALLAVLARTQAEVARLRGAELDRPARTATERIERELGELQERTERLRLLPAATLFDRLERAARDVAAAQGKAVRFEGRGGDVRLDVATLEVVQGALAQLVRNAVAHGVEAPARRAELGKPREGRVALDVRRVGARVVFRCEDDGAGIDLGAVRAAAARRGQALPPGADDDAALLRLLLQGGISTSGSVTEVSGRGVGLDVAHAAAARLGGTLDARSTPGGGTALSLAVPLTLAALDVLTVEAGGASLALPLDGLRRALRLGPADIARGAQGDTVLHEGRALPFAMLARLLGGTQALPSAGVSTLVLEHAGARAAIGVERVREVAGVVLRPLPALAPPCPLASGISVALDGAPRLVLDTGALVQAARRAQGAPAARSAARPPVLVVDDSLTTRMLETSILEAAGYEVESAVSAEEGLERARTRRYALFLVDVEMPGMDGFAFVEHTRADPVLRATPAMLVTSRASPEDRRRGAAAGARGYIDKGAFAQDEFLARVRELVEDAT